MITFGNMQTVIELFRLDGISGCIFSRQVCGVNELIIEPTSTPSYGTHLALSKMGFKCLAGNYVMEEP